jgi:hypothetical protein
MQENIVQETCCKCSEVVKTPGFLLSLYRLIEICNGVQKYTLADW